MKASLEDLIHGGFLAQAKKKIKRRLKDSPSLYDRLLAAIYYRSAGNMTMAVDVLLDADSNRTSYEVAHNLILAYLHDLNFFKAGACARSYLEALAQHQSWPLDNQQYLLDVLMTTESMQLVNEQFDRRPRLLRSSSWKACGFFNIDSWSREGCPGWVYGQSRRARVIKAFFEPQSKCWLEEDQNLLIPELLQPTHDFRGFHGGMRPDKLSGNQPFSLSDRNIECLSGPTVFISYINHFGHFLTNTASFASAIPFAEKLVTKAHPNITLLSQEPVDPWAQVLLQKSCSVPLIFRQLDQARALRVLSLVVCPQTWIEWHYCHVEHRRLFQRVARSLYSVSSNKTEVGSSKKRLLLYFSRSRVKNGLRISVNEKDLEAKLIRLGFQILHPQEMTLPEICSFLDRACLVAGSNGSAMHNIVFRLESAPLATLNFAHFLPSVNCSLLEACCGIGKNMYVRSSRQFRDRKEFYLEYDIPRCVEAAEMAIAEIET